MNIFKHFKVEDWKKSTKEGDVLSFMVLSKTNLFLLFGFTPHFHLFEILCSVPGVIRLPDLHNVIVSKQPSETNSFYLEVMCLASLISR